MQHGSTQLYPLTFEPYYKNYIWGGRSLEKLGKRLPEGPVAESWEISSHDDGMSIVAEGPLAGKSLKDLVGDYSLSLLGSLCQERYAECFPLLFKLIDANDWLSVQVHPQDDYARIHENDLGKTEMWYIVDAQPGAQIYYGLTHRVTREELRKAIEDKTLENLLRSVPVKAGDLFYIPAGTIHAAGKGIIIMEVQQSSNVTYRLYDYDRKNPDGSTRPLHIQKALDVIDYAHVTRNGDVEGLVYEKNGLKVQVMIADPHFCAELVELDESAELLADGRSFMAYTFLSGQAEISWKVGKKTLSAGQSVLIPASLGEYSLMGRAKALRAYIGDIQKDIIAPLEQAGYSLEEMAAHIGGFEKAC
jgi:mannose-6-phosphate isomerase